LIQQKERSLTALNLGAGQFTTDYNFEIAFFCARSIWFVLHRNLNRKCYISIFRNSFRWNDGL